MTEACRTGPGAPSHNPCQGFRMRWPNLRTPRPREGAAGGHIKPCWHTAWAMSPRSDPGPHLWSGDKASPSLLGHRGLASLCVSQDTPDG